MEPNKRERQIADELADWCEIGDRRAYPNEVGAHVAELLAAYRAEPLAPFRELVEHMHKQAVQLQSYGRNGAASVRYSFTAEMVRNAIHKAEGEG